MVVARIKRVGALIASGFLLSISGSALASEAPENGSAYPPIGVFGESVHSSGEVKISYRLHIENRNKLLNGKSTVPLAQVEADYSGGLVPLNFRSYAHIIELAWKPTEAMTLFITVPFLEKTLEQLVVDSDQIYRTSVRGFGDVILNGLYQVFADDKNRVHLNLGLSLPSGSTSETDEAPSGVTGLLPGSLQRLPYIMQLGSGTLSIRPGLTYNGLYKKTFWGGQLGGVLEAGTNSEGYKLGNRYSFSGWVGRRWTPWLQTSFRVRWDQWFNPTGADDQLDPSISPLEDPSMQAGERLDTLFGVDFFVSGGWLKGARISIEGGLPVTQDLQGPQLGADWILTSGLQYAF
ncbi:MAG: transporter [Myxococcota bacterium]|nr:transporter [Myxococcota bacterium]